MPLIRRAEPADAGEVLTLQRAAWVIEAQKHDTPFLPPLTQSLAGVVADLAAMTALVAVEGHRIVGTVRARAVNTDWHIGRLGVVPDLQGRGIGAALLAAIEHLTPAGCRRCYLFTGPKSLDNVAFYERHGYVRLATGAPADGLIHLAKPSRKSCPSPATMELHQ